MEDAKAKKLLGAERARVEGPLKDIAAGDGGPGRGGRAGRHVRLAEPLTTEGTDDSMRAELEERLAALERAEQRLARARTESPCAADNRSPMIAWRPTRRRS